MPLKKATRKHASTKSAEIKKYASKIEKTLRKTRSPYSESRLVEELFNIKLKREGYIPESKEVERLKKIREALKLLMDEKKVIGVTLEDPVTREQILHYSSSGWYATP